MSKSSAIEFVKAIESDEILQEKVKAADSPANVVRIAAEYGYELTEQEIQAALTESRINSEDGELSEELLEAVAGGQQQELAAMEACSCSGTGGACTGAEM